MFHVLSHHHHCQADPATGGESTECLCVECPGELTPERPLFVIPHHITVNSIRLVSNGVNSALLLGSGASFNSASSEIRVTKFSTTTDACRSFGDLTPNVIIVSDSPEYADSVVGRSSSPFVAIECPVPLLSSVGFSSSAVDPEPCGCVATTEVPNPPPSICPASPSPIPASPIPPPPITITDPSVPSRGKKRTRSTKAIPNSKKRSVTPSQEDSGSSQPSKRKLNSNTDPSKKQKM